VSGRGRAALLAVLACAGAGTTAVAALTARDNGGDPPRVTGPLALIDQSCGQKGNRNYCDFDYLLDPSSTNDPADEWHAYWDSPASAETARRGFCTTEVVDALDWGSQVKPTRTFPAVGVTRVGPGVGARLEVDAAGNARVPASLEQTPTWPRGIVTATTASGRLSVRWEGATTRGMSLPFGAEVVNPNSSSMFTFGGDQYEIGLPCAHIAPPGPGFLARIRPPVSAPGRAAYLQVRIPGTHMQPGGSYRGGTAMIAIGSGRPTLLQVVGRSGLKFPAGRSGLYSGRYMVRVTLHGPTGTRHYRLPLRVR
jgi:hypothetical protein